MNEHRFTLAGAALTALPSGALWWPEERLLAVGDLHLGKAERAARLSGTLLPPYETQETLDRLDAAIAETRPVVVVSLGDAFDDLAAAQALDDETLGRLRRMAAGRRIIWISGNHDPGPIDLPGSNLAELRTGPLTFRHIAIPGATGEVSAHYHPKARITLRGQRIARPCFLVDRARAILPAFGAYTGGLDITDQAVARLFPDGGCALLTGKRITALPLNQPT